MKPAAPGVKFTYADFLNFPDDGKRHEIIDGDHYVTPSPSITHQAVSHNLTMAVGAYLKDHRRGHLFAAPLDVVFCDRSVVEPDLLFVSQERSSILAGEHVRGVPDLVVEILSPGTRKTDEVTKRKLYERVGVLEYWVVDPELDTIKIYRRVGDAFVRMAELSVERADALVTPLLPEFSIPLADLFASIP